MKHNGQKPRPKPVLWTPNAPQLTPEGGELYKGGLSRVELDTLHGAGELPLTVAMALEIGEAATLCLQLPAVRFLQGHPIGYGLMPPQGAEPILTIRGNLQDVHGEPVRDGAKGALGCMWRRARQSDRPVFRIWLKGETRPRMIDVYPDRIASVRALEGVIPQLTGWQIVRLDPPTVEAP